MNIHEIKHALKTRQLVTVENSYLYHEKPTIIIEIVSEACVRMFNNEGIYEIHRIRKYVERKTFLEWLKL